MRWVLAVLTIGALARSSHAGEATGSSETLVGWSEDGLRYAVVGFTTNGPTGPEFFIEVRDGNKAVGHWKEGEKGVPASEDGTIGPEKIDVTTWEPMKKFGLRKIEAAQRKKFAAELVAVSTTKSIDRYHCRAGKWTLSKKGGKPFFTGTVGKDHCLVVLGGYLDKAGTHALVKTRDSSQDPTPGEKITTEDEAFILVEVPAK
jgi:hypothetical protein